MSDNVDFSLMARQVRQLITDMGGLRDDMAVLKALALRQDGTLAAVLNELRAMHSQHSRLANRMHDLENQAT